MAVDNALKLFWMGNRVGEENFLKMHTCLEAFLCVVWHISGLLHLSGRFFCMRGIFFLVFVGCDSEYVDCGCLVT